MQDTKNLILLPLALSLLSFDGGPSSFSGASAGRSPASAKQTPAKFPNNGLPRHLDKPHLCKAPVCTTPAQYPQPLKPHSAPPLRRATRSGFAIQPTFLIDHHGFTAPSISPCRVISVFEEFREEIGKNPGGEKEGGPDHSSMSSPSAPPNPYYRNWLVKDRA